MTSLQQRYENPNWFNVAAGFFKPQLGGFAASLGSAAQAMGKNVKSNAPMELPVAAMRAELGRVGLIQKQKNDADQLLKAQDPTKPIPASVIIQLAKLDMDAAKAAEMGNAELTRLNNQISTTVGTNVTQAEAASKFSPTLFQPVSTDLTDPSKKPIDPTVLKTNLVNTASLISGTNPQELANLNVEALQDFIHTNQAKQRDLAFANKTTAGQAVLDTNAELQSNAELRKAIDLPGVGKILNSNKGPTVVGVISNYLAKQNPENAQAMYTALAQIKQDNPSDYRDFEILFKKLTENVAKGRALMLNPSEGATALLANGKPSITNSQDAMRVMVDADSHRLSSAAQNAIFTHRYLTENKGDPSALALDPAYGNLQAKLAKQRLEIIEAQPSSGVPKFYNIYGDYSTDKSPTKPDAVVLSPTPATAAPAKSPSKQKPTAAELFRAARS
jgi:hypothetical protein